MNVRPLQVLQAAALAALTLCIPAGAQADTYETVTWVGTQLTYGERKVPVLGSIQTRTRSTLLARAKIYDDRIEIEQRPCKIKVESNRVQAVLNARSIPTSRTVLRRDEKDGVLRGVSRVSWDKDDIDDDGHPGLRVSIDAKICDGNLHIASTNTMQVWGDLEGRGFRGYVKQDVEQRVLDWDSYCLSFVKKKMRDQNRGEVSYRPVAAGTTCSTLGK